MQVASIALMLILLLSGVATADDCGGCEPTDAPLVPIADPAFSDGGGGLSLVDASGDPLVIDDDRNTLVIGTASWCPGCDALKDSLGSYPLNDLQLVFAFGDESYRGGGSIYDPSYLDNLPGQVAYLAPGSVLPAAFPTVYDPSIGSFGGSAFAAIEDRLGTTVVQAAAPSTHGDTPNDFQPLAVETTPATFHKMFATSSLTGIITDPVSPPPFPTSFGSLEAADWVCTFAAFNGGLVEGWDGLDLVYKAVLSSDTVHAADRTGVTGPVYNTNGDLLASDAADLWDGSLATPVGFDEFGNAIVGTGNTFSGSSVNGLSDTGATCDSWTDTWGPVKIGHAQDFSGAWVSMTVTTCENPARLYCISPPIVVPEPGSCVLAAAGLLCLAICHRRRRFEL